MRYHEYIKHMYDQEEKPMEFPDVDLKYVPKDIRSPVDHYKEADIECVDYLWDNMPFEAFVGGLEWNTKKYLHRWRYKEKPVQDLRKARDYLTVLINVMEGKDPKFNEWETKDETQLDFDFPTLDDYADWTGR